MRYRDQPPIARTHQSKPSARLLRQSRPRSPNQRVKKEGPSPDTNTRSAVKEEAYCVPQSQVESPSSSPISPPPPSLLAICRSPHSPSELRCHHCRTHAFTARRPSSSRKCRRDDLGLDYDALWTPMQTREFVVCLSRSARPLPRTSTVEGPLRP